MTLYLVIALLPFNKYVYKARASLHIILPSFLSTMISRGLAKVAGMLATDGKADGQTFLGEVGER